MNWNESYPTTPADPPASIDCRAMSRRAAVARIAERAALLVVPPAMLALATPAATQGDWRILAAMLAGFVIGAAVAIVAAVIDDRRRG